MKKIASMSVLLLVVAGCTHKSINRSSASADRKEFECRLADNSNTSIKVTADEQEFANVLRPAIATVEMMKDGVQVKYVNNAKIGERLPPVNDAGTWYWSMKVNMGRSGEFYMGYDPVAENWTIASQMLELNTGNGKPATCTLR